MDIVSRHHSRHAIGYHFVFVTKRRRGVFAGKVEAALKRILHETSARHGLGLEMAGIDRDHVHVFVTAGPTWTPGNIARILKGASSLRMRRLFPWLSRRIGADAFWSPSYFVASVGAISEAAVLRYIAAQGREAVPA